jgi:signal transduction histidine kinase
LSREAALEKLYQAERSVAIVRQAIIALNSLVFLFLLEWSESIVWLALTIIVVANAYGVFVLWGKPYRSLPILMSARFTVVSDSALIGAWLIATGGYQSPFFVLWYASITAVAFRYGPVPTAIAAVSYAAIEVGIDWWDGVLFTEAPTIIVRVAYIGFLAALGSMLSQEAYRQTADKVRFRSRAQELDEAVRERTRALEESEQQLQAALEEANLVGERLKELDELKTRFINTAAHELATPLTPVRMQLRLLREPKLGTLTPKQSHALDVLDRNVARLRDLVEEVLDVARLQNRRLSLRLQQVRVEGLLRDTFHSYEPSAVVRGINMELDVEEGLVIRGDRRRIAQVFDNLVHNALKFTPKGRSVRLRAFHSPGGVTVEVEDTGVGLSVDQAARLFRPFVQMHEAMQKAEAGTGLGLFICKGIVEEHGGTITCHSAGRGKGTTFTVHLPVQGPDEEE